MGTFAVATRNGWLNSTISNNLYIALFVGDPESGGVEISGSNYERKRVTPTDWNTPTGGQTTNKNLISFITSTGVWSDQDVTHFALYSAATSGNIVASDDFPPEQQQPIMADNTIQFSPGNIRLEITA